MDRSIFRVGSKIGLLNDKIKWKKTELKTSPKKDVVAGGFRLIFLFFSFHEKKRLKEKYEKKATDRTVLRLVLTRDESGNIYRSIRCSGNSPTPKYCPNHGRLLTELKTTSLVNRMDDIQIGHEQGIFGFILMYNIGM